MLKYRLSLGKYLGVGLYVHWTFALLLAFFAFRSWDQGPAVVGFVLAIICSVFLCVTLHEYGHSLAARMFGISTVDITLFPIGGVARLERMPRIPWQELVVAVAGPAVNVVIATVLAIGLWSTGVLDQLLFELNDSSSAIVSNEVVVDESQAVTTPAAAAEQAAAAAATEEVAEDLFPPPSWVNYLVALFGVNIMLVLFNMIPAFPMDGGRVLRSILAMAMSYRRATFIASRIGLLCAVGGLILWATYAQSNFSILFISLFIAYAGMAEAKQVDVTESVRGLTVSDVMIHNPTAISMDASLSEVVELWRTSSATAIPVLSYVGTVVGIVTPSHITKALKAAALTDADITSNAISAGHIADHAGPTIYVGSNLENVIMSVGRQRQIPVVDATQQLVGLLDLDTIRWRGPLSKMAAPIMPKHSGDHEVE